VSTFRRRLRALPIALAVLLAAPLVSAVAPVQSDAAAVAQPAAGRATPSLTTGKIASKPPKPKFSHIKWSSRKVTLGVGASTLKVHVKHPNLVRSVSVVIDRIEPEATPYSRTAIWLHRVSGTKTNGTWKTTVPWNFYGDLNRFPHSAFPGTWKVVKLGLTDLYHNTYGEKYPNGAGKPVHVFDAQRTKMTVKVADESPTPTIPTSITVRLWAGGRGLANEPIKLTAKGSHSNGPDEARVYSGRTDRHGRAVFTFTVPAGVPNPADDYRFIATYRGKSKKYWSASARSSLISPAKLNTSLTIDSVQGKLNGPTPITLNGQLTFQMPDGSRHPMTNTAIDVTVEGWLDLDCYWWEDYCYDTESVKSFTVTTDFSGRYSLVIPFDTIYNIYVLTSIKASFTSNGTYGTSSASVPFPGYL
jgi:hypothetical protein